ncbi:MAG: PIN domain-containing protein [Phycisphaeraceae bacterium]|nr:PIN domain-containing protein [Phycisphaeraceae bacterium]
MIYLDSSFVIRALCRDTDEAVRLTGWIEAGRQFSMSTMAWAEFMCGPLTADEEAFVRALTPEPMSLSACDAELGSQLFNATGRRRGSLNDCLIAAVAIHADAPLATSNPNDFQRFAPHGLKLAYPSVKK